MIEREKSEHPTSREERIEGGMGPIKPERIPGGLPGGRPQEHIHPSVPPVQPAPYRRWATSLP